VILFPRPSVTSIGVCVFVAVVDSDDTWLVSAVLSAASAVVMLLFSEASVALSEEIFLQPAKAKNC